eukprot:gene5805-6090_t
MEDGVDLAEGPSALPAGELRLVQVLLWTIVSEKLRPAERDEVKRAIGSSIIEENESLFTEADALAQILGDVQLSTGDLMERHNLCANPQRQLVESEIRMLMERLRDAACSSPYHGSGVKERDPESVLPKSNATEKTVYNYLSTMQVAESCPTTASSRPCSASASGSGELPYDRLLPSLLCLRQCGRPGSASTTGRPMTSAGRPGTASTRCSRPSTASSGGSCGSSFDPGSIVQSVQIKATAAPPSVNELREYGSRLQGKVSEEEGRSAHEARVSQMFAAAESEASKAGRLRGMVNANRSTFDAPNRFTISGRNSHKDNEIKLTSASTSEPEILSLQSPTAVPSPTQPSHARSVPTSSIQHPEAASNTQRQRPISSPPMPDQRQHHGHASKPRAEAAPSSSQPQHHAHTLSSLSSWEDKAQLGAAAPHISRQESLKGVDELLGVAGDRKPPPGPARTPSGRLQPLAAQHRPPRVLAPLKGGPELGLPPASPAKAAAASGASSRPGYGQGSGMGSPMRSSLAKPSSHAMPSHPPARGGLSSPANGHGPPMLGGSGVGGKRPVRSVTDMLEAEIETALSGGVAAILAKHGIKNPSRGADGT